MLNRHSFEFLRSYFAAAFAAASLSLGGCSTTVDLTKKIDFLRQPEDARPVEGLPAEEPAVSAPEDGEASVFQKMACLDLYGTYDSSCRNRGVGGYRRAAARADTCAATRDARAGFF